MPPKKKDNVFQYIMYSLHAITMASICGLGWLVAHPNTVSVPTPTKVIDHVSVTAYAPRNNLVATLRKERPGLDAAVSRDRIDLLGKRVYISCGDQSLGVREVVDVMHKDIRNTIDLMVPDEATARKHGVTNACTAQVIN